MTPSVSFESSMNRMALSSPIKHHVPMDDRLATNVATCIFNGLGSALEYDGIDGRCCRIHSLNRASFSPTLMPVNSCGWM